MPPTALSLRGTPVLMGTDSTSPPPQGGKVRLVSLEHPVVVKEIKRAQLPNFLH